LSTETELDKLPQLQKLEAKMKNHPWILSLLISIIVVGCGSTKEKLYTKGPMHPEGNWDGVYQSDFGRLELTVSGNNVVGLYEKNEEYGRLEGEISGNLLFFNWTQWNVEMRGKVRETHGRGVFQYIVEDNEASGQTKSRHWLKGFWNYGNESPTNPWNAYKYGSRAKKKLKPFDPSTYTGNEEEEEDNYDQAGGFQDSSGGGGGGGDNSAPPAESDDGSGDAEIF
jgi:hypothetical protein